MRANSKLILSCIIFFLLGYIVGYTFGGIQMLNWGVNTAVKLIDIDIDIDPSEMVTAITLYKHQINKYIGEENASIYNDTRD